MTLELLLWLIAWVVVSEIIFIVGYFFLYDEDEWVKGKIISFFVGGLFIFIQCMIVFAGTQESVVTFTDPNYIHLLYEAIVIGIIVFLFGINKLIISLISNVDEK